ncbi:MAG: SOS response-associated peptidase [Halieaceae bacterium]|nr:SOS response-associated peptidase [Halieaceae bacterium]
MCGRFNVIDNPGLQQLLKDLGIDLNLPPAINVAPTESVPLVRNVTGKGALDSARWWLTPSWAPAVDQKYAMFNARSETLSRSRAFSTPFKRQRGLVPMSSFIEWRKEGEGRQPYQFTPDSGALAVAALWDIWEKGGQSLLSCTLVTTQAATALEPWHSRMPVMLQREEIPRWLDNSAVIVDGDPVFAPILKQPLHVQPLDRAISRSTNKSPSLLGGVGDSTVLAPG